MGLLEVFRNQKNKERTIRMKKIALTNDMDDFIEHMEKINTLFNDLKKSYGIDSIDYKS